MKHPTQPIEKDEHGRPVIELFVGVCVVLGFSVAAALLFHFAGLGVQAIDVGRSEPAILVGFLAVMSGMVVGGFLVVLGNAFSQVGRAVCRRK